jgi:hypothetical protein
MRFRHARNPLGHHDARCLERLHLVRIIRQQTHGRYTQIPKNRGWQRVGPQVVLEPELLVRLDRVGTFVL